MSGLPKLQHFVPQFLLRQWGTGKNHQVHVFDKQTGRSFASPAKKVGAERGFYNIPDSVTRELIARFREEYGADALPPNFEDGVVLSAEQTLATIESRAATASQRVVRAESLAGLSLEDRVWLAIFASVQFLRTPYMRDVYGALIRGLRERITPLIKRRGRDSALEIEQALERAGLPEPTADRVAHAHLHHLAHGVQDLVPYFLHKHWVLERAPQGTRLYLGDNPITQANNAPGNGGALGVMGLGLPHSEASLPLSPRLNVRMLDAATVEMIRDGARTYDVARHLGLQDIVRKESVRWMQGTMRALDEGGARELLPDEVTRLNARQVRMAGRFVYAADGKFQLAERMLREHPEMRVAPQPVIG